MIEIIPALMPHNTRELEDGVRSVAKHVPIVQLDVMDGKFVPAKSWPYIGGRLDFEALLKEERGLPQWDEVDYEIDLMVIEPDTAVDDWIRAGAARIIVHVESANAATIEKIVHKMRDEFGTGTRSADRGIEFGLALGVQTSIDRILPHLEDIDFVQFMGIDRVGFQGEQLDERVLDTVRQFHNAHPEVILSVDGGVTHDNAHLLVDAGARRLVSGSAIFDSGSVSEAINAFRREL
jgi:ribulose-phosphate 3-epimerase